MDNNPDKLNLDGTLNYNNYSLHKPSGTTVGGDNYLWSDGFPLGGVFTITAWFFPEGIDNDQYIINFGDFGNFGHFCNFGNF